MNGLICNPGLGVIIPRRHDSVAAAPAGPRALADIRRRDQRVPEPPGPPADRTGEARRGAGQREEVPRGRGWWWWLHGCVTFEPWPLVPPQLSEDADAAAKDKGHTSAVSQRQAYRQYVCLFGSMDCMLLTFVSMAKNTQLSFPMFLPELAYNDEQIHKSEKWVFASTQFPSVSRRPELCCNLPVTAPSQNPPVVPRQASKVPLQRGLHAAVQRAPGHNEDLEQVSAAFEVIQHAVDFRHIAKTVFITRLRFGVLTQI